jgi:ABC-type polysaccharide/polyol phosphate export permease
VLGFLWTLLNPLLTVGVLTLVFTYVVRIPIPRYWAFLLSGYFVWNFLVQTLSSGTYVLAEHAQLSRSVAYPKEIPVLAAATSRLFEFGVEIALVLAALSLFHHGGLPGSYGLVPWLMALQMLLALALVFPIASLSLFYQDVQHGLPIVLTTLFYISPVFYSISLVPEGVRPYYLLNPIADLMTLYHTVLYEGRFPSLALLVGWTAGAVVLAGIGYSLFNRYKPLVAEVV